MSFVVKAVKSVVKAVVNVVTKVVKAVVDVVSSVFNFVTQGFMGLLGAAPDLTSNQQAEAQAQGVLIQRQGSIQNIPIVYGCRKMAGVTPYIETSTDERSKYLYVSYVFSEGLVEGLRKVYIDDNDVDEQIGSGNDLIATRLNRGETVTVNWGKYNGRTIMRWFPGVYHADPSTSTLPTKVTQSGGVFNGAPNFKNTMTYNGLATLFVRYEWKEIKTQEDQDNNPFTGSVPVVTVEMLGRRVQRLHDPVTDTDITATDSASYGTNESYSTNPVEILLDYLRNPRYGKGLGVNDIDWTTWHQAAAKCNQEVQFTDKVEDTGAILQLAPVLDTAQTIFNNVKILLQQFRAYMPYVQGKFKLKIEDAGDATDITSGVATIVKTYTKDDIVGGIQYTGIERGSKYNQVVVTYVDPDPYIYKYTNQTVVYPTTETERQTYITQDGGREYKLEIAMPGITNRAIAFDMARLLFNKSRYQETCSLTVTSASFELELGDSVRIQSTILNFDNVPWRIVSMQFNEDHTITLGCVRNPDFIYPHVRVGEPDIVLPTYIPKDVGIYYPKNVELYPEFSIHAPHKASLPTGVTTSLDTDNNPVPSTNPDGLNDTPPLPIDIDPLEDVLLGTKVAYEIIELNGQLYTRISWQQPDIALYEGVRLIWGDKNDFVGQTIDNDFKPGVGKTITQTIGPITKATYLVIHRIKYTSGDYSTKTGSFSFVISADPFSTEVSTTTDVTSDTITAPVLESTITEEPTQEPTVPPPSTDPATTIDTTIEPADEGVGSETPVIAPPPVTARDNWLDTLIANITTAGYSALPRYMDLTLKTAEDISHPINPNIKGFNIYYKESLETYYNKITHTPANYNPADATTKTITFTGYGSGAVTFDMIVKVLYKDDVESTNQHRFRFTLTSPLATYPYNPLQYGVGSKYEASNLLAAQFKTTDQNESPAAVGALAMVLPLDSTYSIFNNSNNLPPSIKFVLFPPNATDIAYWAGQKVRYRPVRPGADPDFETFYDTNIVLSSGTIQSCIVQNIVMDQRYEFVITPQVISGGSIVDATNSWYGTGYVNKTQSSDEYPADGNWNFNFNWRLIDTKTALQTIDEAFAPPISGEETVQLETFTTKIVDGVGSSPPVAYDKNTYWMLSSYHTVRFYFGHITGYSKLHIYRRDANLNSWAGNGANKYYGLGRWEKVTVTDLGVDDYVNVNLRGPTNGSGEYNPHYEIDGKANKDYLYRSWVNSGNPSTNTGKYSYNWKTPLSPAHLAGHEYLFIVEYTDTSLSTKALLVKTKQFIALTTETNQLSPNRPEIVDVSDYNLLDSGYEKRLSEARTTTLTVSDVGFPGNIPTSATYDGVITKALQYPTTDRGVAITPAIV